MDIDLSIILKKITDMVENFLAQLPNVLLAIIIIVIFYYAARAAKRFVTGLDFKLSSQALLALGRIVQWAVIILGVFVGMTVAFPSVDFAAMLSLLGVGGVAIGFAFRDILQNFFAGLILLFTEPFKIGDQIIVNDYEGTVMRIETRGTYLRTYDGRIVIIPNAEEIGRLIF